MPAKHIRIAFLVKFHSPEGQNTLILRRIPAVNKKVNTRSALVTAVIIKADMRL